MHNQPNGAEANNDRPNDARVPPVELSRRATRPELVVECFPDLRPGSSRKQVKWGDKARVARASAFWVQPSAFRCSGAFGGFAPKPRLLVGFWCGVAGLHLESPPGLPQAPMTHLSMRSANRFIIPVRANAKQKAALKQKAQARGLGVSTWLLQLGLSAPDKPSCNI